MNTTEVSTSPTIFLFGTVPNQGLARKLARTDLTQLSYVVFLNNRKNGILSGYSSVHARLVSGYISDDHSSGARKQYFFKSLEAGGGKGANCPRLSSIEKCLVGLTDEFHNWSRKKEALEGVRSRPYHLASRTTAGLTRSLFLSLRGLREKFKKDGELHGERQGGGGKKARLLPT